MKFVRLRKDGKSAKEIADEIYAAIEAEFGALPDEIVSQLADAASSGVTNGMTQLDVSDTGLISSANDLAGDYAVSRAAELVGMRYDDDGNLIQNPDAEWAISDTTRDKLRAIIADAFSDETPLDDVAQSIEDTDAFSPARADMIARTEVQNAQVQGNFNAWQESGLVEKISWSVSDDDPCDVCADNDGEEVDLGDNFPSGDQYPPAHPNCQCVVYASSIRED